MKKALLLLLFIIPVQLFAGVEFFKSTLKTFDRVKEKNVLLLQEKPAICEEVGTIIATTKNEIQAITVAKKVASKNGANAIYIIELKDMDESGQVANRMLHAGVRGKYKFIAVRLPELGK